LKDGVTLAQARSDLAAVTSRLREQYPDANAKLTAPNVLPLQEEIVGGYRAALWLLLGAVGMVLLIACANLANLLLARATSRHKEIAIRAALGATRSRLVRQMLTESLLLAVAGGALGLLLAMWGSSFLIALSPADLPRAGEVVIDGRMLLFSLALSLLAGTIFGLAPAFQTTKTDLNAELKEGERGGSGRASSGLRSALVVAEVVLDPRVPPLRLLQRDGASAAAEDALLPFLHRRRQFRVESVSRDPGFAGVQQRTRRRNSQPTQGVYAA